jgi:hypothetical protein
MKKIINLFKCKPNRYNRISRLNAFSSITDVKDEESNIINKSSLSSSSSSSYLTNFISNIIDEDISLNRNGGKVITRFPPEPNGYLHLGHAKSINFNFSTAKVYNGNTNMRFDDTNPSKENMEYMNAILDDVRWLMTSDKKSNPPPWNGNVKHSSDYFQVLYELATCLIKKELAYVENFTSGIVINIIYLYIYLLINIFSL